PFVLAGSLSMAYSAYAAIGAYGVAIVSSKLALPVWAGWLVGPPVAALVAVGLGLATRRLSSFFLAAVTLLFAEAFAEWLATAEGLTGGSAGLLNLPFLDFFGWQPAPEHMVLLAAVLVCLLTFALDRLRHSPWGVLVQTMRETPIAVEAVGVRVPTLQLVALGLGAAIAALGGALFTTFASAVNPKTFGTSVVFLAVFMPLIGGRHSPWGSLLGAGVVTWLTLDLDQLGASGTLMVALGVLVIILVAPRGLLGYLRAGFALVRERRWSGAARR
ncbi:branched-chain amino acid ABC transporter permease, partial [Saccharopolyspora sp. NPDC002686]|uniref:branched-chain amino acid ABC transporter permease n=1 Tax=Saccharopolyspora sp. NPDC002686 TaxID=3154541 RepID=UPI003318592A